MKNNKGITLVALVVTIIVLIILAGISINLILGDNGIITIAKKAKENTELAKTEEETNLNELYTQLEIEGSSSGNLPYDSIAKLAEFKTAIANAIEEAGGIKPEVSAETAVFANNIKGIVKEVTKNATATADNISEGKTAWVNGELITGVGKDVTDAYNKGIEEGKKSSNTEFKSTHITGCNSDVTLDVSSYSTFSFDLTVLHPYVNIYITADGTNIYTKLASNSYTGETKTFDVSGIEKIRIYTTQLNESYVVKGYQLDITLK